MDFLHPLFYTEKEYFQLDIRLFQNNFIYVFYVLHIFINNIFFFKIILYFSEHLYVLMTVERRQRSQMWLSQWAMVSIDFP